MHRLSIGILLFLATTSMAQDLGSRAPAKNPGACAVNVPDPARQGGDTVATATIIPGLPYHDTGATTGFQDDYLPTCIEFGGAPDVVYRLTTDGMPPEADGVTISLCGSTYDTALIVYDANLVEVDCNDDYCGLRSQVERRVTPGQTYYIVVDGYGQGHGAYVLDVDWQRPCVLDRPDYSCDENEPPLHDGYDDAYNSGCDWQGGRFVHIHGGYGNQHIPPDAQILNGISGWYVSGGTNCRDTDWYTLTVGPSSAIEIFADAEYPTYIFELSGNCESGVQVAQQATVGPCLDGFMTIIGTPYSTKWFWVGPTVFASPDGTLTYDYVIWFTGLYADPYTFPCRWTIATEAMSWGAVKALYR